MRLVEKKGWKRKSENPRIRRFEECDQSGVETDENHDNEDNKKDYYFLRSCQSFDTRNPFFLKTKIYNTAVPVLIDTGADVSIINERWIEKDNRIVYEEAVIKSACGNRLNIVGRVKKLQMRIGIYTIELDPYIVRGEPSSYAIIGADTIKKNQFIMSKIINKTLQGCKLCNTLDVYKQDSERIKEKYKDMFKTEIDKMTMSKVGTHSIKTKPGAIVCQKNFQVPYHLEKEIDNEIQKYLKTGIIVPSKSSFSSGIVPVRKKDGKLRICVDFRQLNVITEKDKYPIPRIDEILDEMGQGELFTTLDATSGYYQIPICEEDKKTAFRWKGGFFEFTRMPFGLCNAPATFQRTMDEILKEYNWKFVIPYLDDIIIYSKNIHEHVIHVEKVMKKLQEAGIALNISKCKFFQNEIEILGNIVKNKSIMPDPNKTNAINNFKLPTDVRGLRSFLGLVNYCRDFIPNLAHMSIELYDMLRGEAKNSTKKVNWTEKAKQAFIKIKSMLSSSTERAQPDFLKEFILTTDAFDKAYGAILSQKRGDSNKEETIYAFSRTMDDTQRNYSVTDKELLAVVKAMEHFRRYLIGKEFILRTDHKAIAYINETKNPNSRLLRWALKLQEFAYKVEYIKGESNAADCLSRNIQQEEKVNALKTIDKEMEKQMILKEYHTALGHGSARSMEFLLLKKYKWCGIKRDIKTFVKKCQICLRSGEERQNTKNRVFQVKDDDIVWQIDLIGRIPTKNSKYKFIFVAIELNTKWVELRVIKQKQPEIIIESIKDLIIGKHGKPTQIISDNAREFRNATCNGFAIKEGIKWSYNSPGHHKGVGSVESVNRTIRGKLKKLCNYGKTNWECEVYKVALAINYSVHRGV